MAGENDEKRLVRFDLPRGLDAASIAQAIREHGRRILDEAPEQRQAAERDGTEQAPPEASPSRGSGQAEGRLPEEPGAET